MLFSAEQLIEQIHDSPRRIVLAAAGGGSRAIADLLEVPRFANPLGTVVPYSAGAMVDFWAVRRMSSVRTQRPGDGRSSILSSAGVTRSGRYAGRAWLYGQLVHRPAETWAHRVHLALQTDALTAV